MLVDENTFGNPRDRAAALPARRLVLLARGFGCMIGYARMASLGFVGYLSQGVIESVDPWYALRSAVCVAVLALLAVKIG